MRSIETMMKGGTEVINIQNIGTIIMEITHEMINTDIMKDGNIIIEPLGEFIGLILYITIMGGSTTTEVIITSITRTEAI